MTKRNIVVTEAPKYVEGYLHERIRRGQKPQYGYPENCLPKTRGQVLEVESIFAKAKRRTSAL
jgi:hypothetical protein